MSLFLSTFRGRPNNRKWLSILIVLGLLLAAYVLPARLAQRGISFLFLLVAVPLAALVLPRPWLGLALLLAYGPFAAAVRFAGASNWQSLLKDLFAVALVAAWLVRWALERRTWSRSVLDVPLVLFLTLAAIQAIRGPSLLRGVLALKILATYVPIYFLVVNNPPTRKQVYTVLGIVLAVAAVTAVYGLYQYVTLGSTSGLKLQIEGQEFLASGREGRTRVFSTFTHSTVFALYLALMIALGLSVLMATSRNNKFALVAGLVLLMLLVLPMPLTLSRIGWIGAIAGLLVLTILAPVGKWRIGLLLAGLLIVALFFLIAPPQAQRTLQWSFTDEDISFTIRSDLIYWGYRMTFVELPLGCGLGSQPDSADLAGRITRTYEPPYTCFWRGYQVSGADTVALAVGVQMGALGYLLFALIHAIILWRGVWLYRSLHDPLLRSLAAGLIAYFAIMTFSNFFSGSTQAYPVVDLYFWFFAGLLMSLKNVEQSNTQQVTSEGAERLVETATGH